MRQARLNTRHDRARTAIPFIAAFLLSSAAMAQDIPAVSLPTADGISFHLQSTFLPQGYLPFSKGPGDPASGNGQSTETWTITGYFGARLWEGTEVFINPETFHGFLLRDYSRDTVAVAASVGNGEAQKGGRWDLDPYIARVYVSQTFGFGGEKETIKDDLNQIAGVKDISRLTVTFGKLAVTDIFDTNAYAHDPRSQFQNWALFDGGAFDYAADLKGYTVGAVAELNQKDFALRAGYFLVPIRPNALELDTEFTKRGGAVLELENRYTLFSQPGKLRLTGFANTVANAFDYAAAAAALNAGEEPTLKTRTKLGYVINMEQALTEKVGIFFRYSWNDGKTEICCFTDINESVSGGVSIKGGSWGRPSDTIGIATALNTISPALRSYLAAGGQGLLIGDGALPSYSGEKVFETYYSYVVSDNLTVSADYQLIGNAAYFADRGPINMISGRVHVQF